jgi:putative intracellular protease/amidase
MRRTLLLWTLLLIGGTGCSGLMPAGNSAGAGAPAPAAAPATTMPALIAPIGANGPSLAPYSARFGRARPVVAVVGENSRTYLTHYVVPYGILAASGVAEVMALSTQPGPIRMAPAPMMIQPHATTAGFDQRFPDGADYVIVPAVQRADEPALVAWVAGQAAKGATVVGVSEGAWVLGHAGLLQGRAATGHWRSLDDLQGRFAQTRWQKNRRYVADGPVVTTAGASAAIPVSLALVEAIAGQARAASLAAELGAEPRWGPDHASERFKLDAGQVLAATGNTVAFWRHEDVGILLEPGIDEIALALQAEVYSATRRSTAYTVTPGPIPVISKRGLAIIADRASGASAPQRMLPVSDFVAPLRALDQALKGVETDYGRATATWVAVQMEYPGY